MFRADSGGRCRPGRTVAEKAQARDSAILAREARWERNSGLSMAEVGTAPALLGFRAEEHAVRILFGGDASAEGRARVESLMEHEAYRAAFHLVVRARGEGLNAALREALLASPGYALARTLIEQGERRHGPVSEETQAAQASLLETQARARWETDGIDWGEVDAAIEAIEAQAASKAPSPAAAGRAAERWSALTPKERTAERQAGPEALPALLAKHDKNIARRAKERAFRQWAKERMAADPERFEPLSSKEKRAAFNAEREALSGADAAVAVVETVVAQEIEAEEDGMQIEHPRI